MNNLPHIGCIGEDCPICPKLLLPEYASVKLYLSTTNITNRTNKATNLSNTNKQKSSKAHSRPRLDCQFLGSVTENMVTCPSCTGRVELKIFECKLFTSCTIEKKAGEIACCATCDKYQPLPRI